MNTRPTPNFQKSRGRDNASHTSPSNPKLCVTVIPTTTEGTAAALHAARWLAKDLEARITILKMEVVPSRFPLDEPPVSPEFATKQQCSLVFQSNAREEEVTTRTCLCRDRDAGLQSTLRRRALVIIGGRRRWWSSGEERLEQTLRRLGHHVIFVDLGHKTEWTSQSRCPRI